VQDTPTPLSELITAGNDVHFAMVELLKAYAAVQEYYGFRPQSSPIYLAAQDANKRHVSALTKAGGKNA
jgi:hypothetical protein